MPEIKTFQAPELSLRPTETGIEATAATARRIGAFYNQTGQALTTMGERFAGDVKAVGNLALEYAEHREISHGAATFAELNDNLTRQWNNTVSGYTDENGGKHPGADPNDPSVAAKFRQETLEPALEQYKSSFNTEGGQKFAEARIENLRNHMFTKTAADMSSMAKDAVTVNMQQTANSLSNTAMMDPSAVDHLLSSADALVSSIIDTNPNLKGPDASHARMELTQKMKENIIKAGAIGAIQRAADPEAEADRWGRKYPDYINGAELKTLAGNARQQIRARNYDTDRAKKIAKDDAVEKSNDATDKYLIDIQSQSPRMANDPLAAKVVNDPRLLKADKSRLLGIIERQLKPETDSRLSSETFTDLLRKLRDPDADPEKIMQDAWDARLTDPGKKGSLSERDFNAFRTEVTDRKTPDGAALSKDRDEFFKRYAGTIDGYLASQGIHSALGSQKMYDAQISARREEQALKKQGKDPHSLYDPSSPNFFGRPENIAKYQVSMQDALNYGQKIGTKNLTGPGTTVTGVTTKDITFNPPSNWQFSASRQEFRDPEGNIYDLDGKLKKKNAP